MEGGNGGCFLPGFPVRICGRSLDRMAFTDPLPGTPLDQQAFYSGMKMCRLRVFSGEAPRHDLYIFNYYMRIDLCALRVPKKLTGRTGYII
jgi:hypothetical protein